MRRWLNLDTDAHANERAFMLFAANTIFMFGKKYLDEEQLRELRRLSGLQVLGA